MAPPKSGLDVLSFFEPRLVPVAAQKGLATEQSANFGRIQFFAVEMFLNHNVEQRFQGRAGLLDASIVEIHPGNPLLCCDDVVDAINEDAQILLLGSEHGFSKNRMRVI